jgi:DNA polymerase phi
VSRHNPFAFGAIITSFIISDVDAQREATHFKNRVLDLVDLYLKKQPTNALVLRFIIPLVDLVAGSSQDERQLADKAMGILRQRFGKTKEVPVEAHVEQVSLVATQLHAHARKSHSSDLLSILSVCSLYVGKLLVQLKEDETLQDVYKQSLVDFATRKNSSLNAPFFQDFVRRFPPQAWAIRQDLVKQCRKAINAYRKCQILQLVDKLYTLLPSMVRCRCCTFIFLLLTHIYRKCMMLKLSPLCL